MAGNLFIPASTLTQLRRETITLLDLSHRCSFQRELRKTEDKSAPFPYQSLSSADNVANHISEQFYKEHGATHIEPAIECSDGTDSNEPVMHTRYCLRRELGACLKNSTNSHRLPSPLFLRNSKTLLQVDCDCKQCEMKITIVKK